MRTQLTTLSIWRNKLLPALMIAMLGACGGQTAPEQTPPYQPPVEIPTDQPDDEDPITGVGCNAPAHLTLTDVESVTDWVNALPKPLALPCFIESLPRPLQVNMTESVFSAQPSNGRGNPRVFIFLERLIFSVVPQEDFEPDEAQINLLEISFRTEGIQSIKAEIPFPVLETLSYGDAYTSAIIDPSVSSCGICHTSEVEVGRFDDTPVFQSQMLRPYDGFEITVGLLKNETKYCDALAEPHRCAMLNALVGEGDIYWQEFSAEIPILE